MKRRTAREILADLNTGKKGRASVAPMAFWRGDGEEGFDKVGDKVGDEVRGEGADSTWLARSWLLRAPRCWSWAWSAGRK